MLVAREIIQGDGRRRSWARAGNRQDPLANPLHGDLRGLPPIYIQVGGYETLLDDSRELAEALRRADVRGDARRVPEMQHVFHFLAGVAPGGGRGDPTTRRLGAPEARAREPLNKASLRRAAPVWASGDESGSQCGTYLASGHVEHVNSVEL